MTANQSDSHSVPICSAELKPHCIAQKAASLTSPGEPEFLSDYSPNDRPWDYHRAEADVVSGIYSTASHSRWFTRLGERINACAPWLRFRWARERDDPHVSRLKLEDAYFCRVRLCPICQWRRTLMWTARFMTAVPTLKAKHPRARFLFLTLSCRNPPVSELRFTLREMAKAWDRVRKRREFGAVLGWIRAAEVTRGKDGTAHPHYHVLLMVTERYFSRDGGYMGQGQWTKIWRDSLKLDYDPIVHITAVRAKRGRPPRGGRHDGLMGAARETLKYAVKPSDMTADPSWLLDLTRELHRLRFIASGGVLKDVLREHDESPEDMLLLGDGALDEGASLYFDWRRRVQRYKRRTRVQ